jgi:predicted nucleic acid-binding protein
MIVLDTNIVSELMRAVPAPRVVAWLQQHADHDLATTAVTVAEIRYGIARLPSGRRRVTLGAAADEIFTAFPDQILAFDLAAAHAYADIVSHRDGLGTPIEGFDAQIAAICRTRAADLATRNEKDFTGTGITIINPWQPDPA